MSTEKRVLAFDFGASSGRAMLGKFDGEKITLEEIHRFENNPVKLGDTLYWDVYRLFYEVKQGISKAALAGGFDSIGVDTWGVDFGLIDKNGTLMGAPVHYRDSRNVGMADRALKMFPRENFYKITGNQFMDINTVFQLLYLRLNRPQTLKNADKLLLMPDLFNYLLTGVKRTEVSIASTTQMMNAVNKNWSETVLDKLKLPKNLLTKIVPSGTVVGRLREDICKELNAPAANVIAVCGHDTQCAVCAVPAEEKDFIFISCGTWSLFGTELDEPLINPVSEAFNITNETGYGGKTTFLKNIIGLWLIQETRRQFKREGTELSYAELERLALAVEPFKCFIDPDAPEFVPEGDIPERVREFCGRTGQYVPQSVGEVMRCVYESLALKYRQAFEEIKICTGKEYRSINLIGGGAKDGLLCKMTANACNCKVTAGPIEATAYGNIAIQLMADGAVSSLDEARKIIAVSDSVKTFLPENPEEWESAYERYVQFTVES
ncbi:MAG: rhamnulokinase [Ruminococcus sp.]|nr:rhamnulokinase [Ruminococcus sp.]MCM1382584.1 rhamnulokinase [Muribaculaceae bacterium]MCM1480714.1 rhamnulokinase [Muribaculaceae bacterium]